MHIRRNDIVVATIGRSAGAGKTGKVLQVMPKKRMAVVEGFNIVKKAMRKTNENPHGGIGEREAPMAISNLMLYCSRCKKGIRAALSREAGKRIRKCRKCGQQFDS